MKKETKAFLKKGLKVVVGIVVLAAMTMSVLTGCAQTINKENDGPSTPIVNPDNPSNPESIVTPDNPDKPTDPIVNPDDPTNPDDPGKDDPTNPDNPDNQDNPSNPDNPDDPTNPDNPSNPDNPEVNPDVPSNPDNPEVNPDDPTPDDPQPGDEELDFSALETKLEEVITSQSKYNKVNEILSYSVNDGKIYIVYDYNTKRDTCVTIYSADINNDLSNQEKIDSLTNQVSSLSFEKVIFYKALDNITVDGETYSKDGIAGDNIFAEKCGVENAVMTYVGTPGSNNFDSRFNTGYSKQVQVLALYNDASNNLVAKKVVFDVENFSGYSNDQVYTNLVTEGKSILHSEDEYNLGENLKASPEVEAMNAAFLGDEFDEYVQGNLNYIYH